jgi:hypothetical protein
MRSTVIRRTAIVAASALSLALVVGCDSSDSGTDDAKASSSAPAGSASASAPPAATPLTAAELKKASLTTADIDGFSVKTPGKGDVYSQATVKVAKSACAPVAYALSGAPLGKPSVTEQRQLTSKSKASSASPSADELASAYDVSVSLVTLSSYPDQAAAEAVLKSVTDAGSACAGGFTAKADGEDEKVTKLVTDTAPKGADEAVALTATAVQDGSTGPMKVVVLRKGATVAYFTAINVASFISGDDFEFPTEIVDAQLAKLS